MSERDTIPATCPRCGRPRGMESAERCYEPGAGTCVIAAAAYRRGIEAGRPLPPEAERDRRVGAAVMAVINNNGGAEHLGTHSVNAAASSFFAARLIDAVAAALREEAGR